MTGPSSAEPTYYPPGANPAWCTPVCSLCGSVVGPLPVHRAALLLRDGIVHRRDSPCYVQDERAARNDATARS